MTSTPTAAVVELASLVSTASAVSHNNSVSEDAVSHVDLVSEDAVSHINSVSGGAVSRVNSVCERYECINPVSASAAICFNSVSASAVTPILHRAASSLLLAQGLVLFPGAAMILLIPFY